MKQEPLISIILPVCNSAQHLAHCLKSLLSQSYKNIEIIAIDDCSKDESFTILKSYKKLDNRIRAYRNKKRYNLTICLNRALKRAKGTLIAFMDANDIAARDRIKKQVNFLLSNPQITAVGTQASIIDDNGKKLEETTLPSHHQSIVEMLLSGQALQFETTMVNKYKLPKDLLYFTQTKYPLLFNDLFLKLLPYGEFANLPHALQKRRNSAKKIDMGITHLPELFKMWITTIGSYNNRPSLRSLFTPLIRQA